MNKNRTESLRVLHVISEKTWRGGEQQIANLIEESLDLGLKPHASCRSGSAFAAYAEKLSIPLHYASFRWEYDPLTALSLKRYCIKHQIDIIHAHSGKSHGVCVLSHRLGNPAKIVITRRIPRPSQSTWLAQYKYQYPGIEKIIGVSDAITCMMRASTTHPQICSTIYSGVNLSAPPPNAALKTYKHPNTFLIGSIAALVWHKGLFTFITACHHLIQEGLPLQAVILGEGELRKKLTKYIVELGLENQIHLPGFISNVQGCLPDLDAFVLASNEEGLGTSILDAMAQGVPVAATATGGIPQMIIDETSGLLSPVGDAKHLAMQIKRLLLDRNLAAHCTENAKRRVETLFSKRKMAENNIDVYYQLFD